MANPIGPEAVAEVLAEYDRSGSIRRAAASAGCSFGAAKRVILARSSGSAHTTVCAPSVAEADSSRTVEYESDTIVETLDDAIRKANVDLSVWRVRKWSCTGWSVGMKVRSFTQDGRAKLLQETPVKKQLWRVRLELERILPRSLEDATEAVFERMKGYAPKYEASKVLRIAPSGNEVLAVMDLVDVHFGKLAWAAETGQNYDLKIADRVYREAVSDLIGRASGFRVEEFLLPLGSDFLHVDNLGGTTTAGTPQDVDGRLAKILETAEQAVIWAVEAMAQWSDSVRVVWVPGNHDRLMSYCLARTVAAWFRSHPGVSVDVAPTTRKYHRYHATLIGLTHGDCEKPAQLPIIMATERPGDWAQTTCREWHAGHYHKSKRVDSVGLDTHGGVPVRTLRSLSAVDAWHYRSGFVGSQRAAEMYLYDHSGYVGHFVANVREPESEQRRQAA